MRLLTTFSLLTICLTASGQTFPAKKDSRYQVDTSFTKKYAPQKRLTYYPNTNIDSESLYSDSTGIVVIIQNSRRRAGGTLDSTKRVGYTDAIGKHFTYAIFWNRIINESTSPLELTINFPADSFAIADSTGSYFKVFLPTDTMTLAKEVMYNYGAAGLKSFLDTSFNKPSTMERTINPKEACLFYILLVSFQTGGIDRTELVLKEQELFYKINMARQLDPALIPCGQIVLKNSRP